MCESQLANPEDNRPSDPNHRHFYDAMKGLKEVVTENDIVTILWFVPSFRLHMPSLAVQADSQKAPFLYHGFQLLQESCLASDLFIISGEQSNEMSVWTRLFECTSCWVRPESFPLPSQPTQSDESVIHETGDSLVIDPSSDITVADLRSQSHLPSIACDALFELPFDEIATFLTSILHLPLSPKYRFEWCSVTNSPANFTAFVPAHSLSLHVTPAILSRDHSIHILHKIDSFSLLHILHLFLDSTFLSVSLQNDRYVVVTDGDVASQAFHRLRHNESLSEAFHPPSFFPPLKRDVTLFSPRGEAYLRGMRETVGKREPFHSRSHRRNLGGKNSSGKRRRKKGGKPVAHVW